jgi:uncharacterized protein (UPF0332 family)
MSLDELYAIALLRKHRANSIEIKKYLTLIERDLRDCNIEGLGLDWRFSIAFNAILQAANAALAAAGYRTGQKAHQAVSVETLMYTLGLDKATYRILDTFRTKRNVSKYEMSGTITQGEVSKIISMAHELFTELVRWLRDEHPSLIDE